MKLKVILEGKSEINVDVENGEEIFREITANLLNKVVGESKGIYKSRCSKILQNFSSENSNKNKDKGITDTDIKPHTDELIRKNEMNNEDNDTEDIQRKILVITKCTECGKISIIPLLVKDNKALVQGDLLCRNCGSKLNTDNLSRGEGKCADCGGRIYFYAQGTEDFEINCKHCDSPIDLLYNSEKKQFRSANLFGIKRGKLGMQK